MLARRRTSLPPTSCAWSAPPGSARPQPFSTPCHSSRVAGTLAAVVYQFAASHCWSLCIAWEMPPPCGLPPRLGFFFPVTSPLLQQKSANKTPVTKYSATSPLLQRKILLQKISVTKPLLHKKFCNKTSVAIMEMAVCCMIREILWLATGQIFSKCQLADA